MRIKLATSSPLPNYNCWFVLTENIEAQTVHHLRRKIVKDLELNSEPSLLQLSMDGFHLLPQSNIQGLLRDGDLINVEQVNSVKPIIKKRKPSSVEESSPSVKKSKKEKSTKTSKPESEEKKKFKTLEKEGLKARKIKSSKAPEKKRSRSEEKVIKSKKTPKQVTEEKKVAEETVQKSTPFEGKEQTKKRNMRRRELKRRLRTAAVDPLPVQINTSPALIDQELQIQNLNISNVEPSQLLKKNKNKKKNHMKQMDQRCHVHYPQDKEVTAPEQVIAIGNNGNLFGRAFVTFVESERNYKERQNSHFSQEYPIHRMPTLFYANQGLTENELNQPETELVDQAQPAEVHQIETVSEVVQPPVNHVQEEKEINYNDLVQVTFTDNVPVGSKLAIKTLELTSSYTPEISDWKHVILKQIDTENGQVKFEFLPGYGKATTKGGKFDNKKNRKRYDDWYDQRQQQQDEEEEEEENEATFEMTDIFEMRIIS